MTFKTAPESSKSGEVDSFGFVLVFLDNPGKVFRQVMLPMSGQALVGVSRRTFMQERWLSVDEIAAYLGVNPDTIYKWITRKKMPAHKLGRLWKFLASEVDQWIKGGQAAKDIGPAAPVAAPKRRIPRH
jgi:excisionase family DNA binding protein